MRTVWPATLPTPGRIGLPPMRGVPVAAAFAGEPFGLGEAPGAVQVISAGLAELLGRGESPSATMD